jgi:hypothetical protein
MVEIGLWSVALLVGLGAAVLYLVRRAWFWPLVLAALSVVVIFVLTFVQPPILVRLLLDAGLVAGVAWLKGSTKIRTKNGEYRYA